MRRIGVVGAGHVGLVTGACFARLGHPVICADNDARKIAGLRRLEMPFYEPGLEKLVAAGVRRGLLSFTTSVRDMAAASEVIFVAVGTPPAPDGRADLSYVRQVTRAVADALVDLRTRRKGRIYRLIVEKSTVPVLTGDWVRSTFDTLMPTGVSFDVAANPEFLREGNAVEDFFRPDRIVAGVSSRRAERILREIYRPLKAPLVFCDVRSAELIKHASNSFLALKIAYINALSQVCERVGADIVRVAEGMGHDRRIGSSYLRAGIGFGGSCFPKDVSAFIALSADVGYPFSLLRDVRAVNRGQVLLAVRKARRMTGGLEGVRVGVLGLSFKPDTDDVRDSPALEVVRLLLKEGARVRCWDPRSLANARAAVPGIEPAADARDAARGASLLLLLTEWKEFLRLDFAGIRSVMKRAAILDGRNALNRERLERLGFVYEGIGRGSAARGPKERA